MSNKSHSSSPPPPWELANRRMQGEIDDIKQNMSTMMRMMTNMSNDMAKLIQTQDMHAQTRNRTPSPHEPTNQTQTPQAFDHTPRPRRQTHYHQRTTLETPPFEEKNEGSHESSSEPELIGRRRNEDDDRGLRVDLPEFNGSSDPNDFIDWLHEIERV